MKIKNLILAGIVIFIILAAIGYFREFVFTAVNFRLRDQWYGRNNYPLPASLGFLDPLSYNQLWYFKWILTVSVSLGYLAVFLSCIWYFFRSRKYLVWTIIAFTAVYLISGIFYLYGILFSDFNNGYTFSRIFMDFVQSPFLLMLLIPAFLLDQRNLQNKAS
jgi:hypothetical protein